MASPFAIENEAFDDCYTWISTSFLPETFV
jgi:hypothetical protein